MPGVTKTTDINVAAREIDFVTQFGKNWTALQEILGIMRPIQKKPGTTLVSYNTSLTLESGNVAEAETIPFSKASITPVSYDDITVEKFAKSVSVEAVAQYGADVAVIKTDEEFRNELQSNVMNRFYDFLKTGTLTDAKATWQMAFAMSQGYVRDKFKKLRRDVTDIIQFVNILDVYEYLGAADISVQTQGGMTYLQNFMGARSVILSSDIERGKVIAVPANNIDLYYIDPADSDIARLGLRFTVSGETPLIGFHAEGKYSNMTGEAYALMGMKLWAEYLDGISVVYVGTPTKVTTAETVTAESDGVTFNFAHSPVVSIQEVKDGSTAVTTGFRKTDSGIVFDTAPTGTVTVKYTYAATSV